MRAAKNNNNYHRPRPVGFRTGAVAGCTQRALWSSRPLPCRSRCRTSLRARPALPAALLPSRLSDSPPAPDGSPHHVCSSITSAPRCRSFVTLPGAAYVPPSRTGAAAASRPCGSCGGCCWPASSPLFCCRFARSPLTFCPSPRDREFGTRLCLRLTYEIIS
jgi:hypothetical protein